MQLREVGKLAAYLWKMRWLQRPGRRALPQAVWRGGVRPCERPRSGAGVGQGAATPPPPPPHGD